MGQEIRRQDSAEEEHQEEEVTEAFIERQPVEAGWSDHLERWKALWREGWDVTVLVDSQHKTSIAFGCRPARSGVGSPSAPS